MFSALFLCMVLILLMSEDGTSTSYNSSRRHINGSKALGEEFSGSDTIQGGRRDTSGAHPNCKGRVEKFVCDASCSGDGICADDDLWVPVHNCTSRSNMMCLNGQCIPGSAKDCLSSENGADPDQILHSDGRAWTSINTTSITFTGVYPNCMGLTGQYACDENCSTYGVCTRTGSWVPVRNCIASPNKICLNGQCVPGTVEECPTHAKYRAPPKKDDTKETNATIEANKISNKLISIPRDCTGLTGQYVCNDNCTTNGVCATEDSWVPVVNCNAYPDTICVDGECVPGNAKECSKAHDVRIKGKTNTTRRSVGGTGFEGPPPDCTGHLLEYLCDPDCKAAGVCVAGEPGWVDTEYCAQINNVICLDGSCVPGTIKDCPGH